VYRCKQDVRTGAGDEARERELFPYRSSPVGNDLFGTEGYGLRHWSSRAQDELMCVRAGKITPGAQDFRHIPSDPCGPSSELPCINGDPHLSVARSMNRGHHHGVCQLRQGRPAVAVSQSSST